VNDRQIAPGLLLAMPQLGDPNFFRAVVLMVEHSESGSFGLIVNRRTELPVREVLDGLGMRWSGEGDAMVWQGGPVMPQSGWVVHEPTEELDPSDSVDIAPGIVLSTSNEQLRELAARPPAELRFVMGYSGWGAGQLESELSEGVWLAAEATVGVVFHAHPERMWEEAIRSLGIDPATLVPGTGIH
jgi:putative transcriptional regulator